MAKPIYTPLLQDIPEALRNLPTLAGIAALADTAFEQVESDIYDTSQLLSVETTTDFSYLQELFDPYGLIDILLGNVADSRKYYRLLKTLYTLKGTSRGFGMAMDLLKLTYQEIISANVQCCTQLTMVLATTQPDLLQFRKVDQLDQVYLPIDTSLTGVTNAPIVSNTPGPYHVSSLTANSLDYNLTLGVSRLGYPLGAKIPTVSDSIYFLFWSTLLSDLIASTTTGADSVMDYIYSSDFVYDTASATRLDWELFLGWQQLPHLLPPITNLVSLNSVLEGYAYGDYRKTDFLRPNYGVPPDRAAPADDQVGWDTYETGVNYHAMILGANTLGAYAWQPLGGPRQTANWGGGLGQGKIGRNVILDRAKDLYYTRSTRIDVAVEHPAVEMVATYDMGDADPADLTNLWDEEELDCSPAFEADSVWSIAGAQTSGVVGFAVVGEARVGVSVTTST